MRVSNLFNVVIFTIVLMLASHQGNTKPRVFIFTDINIDRGDPDDRQSLVHLLWYTDELKILGIVPDRWNAEGYEASMLAVDAYADDYDKFGFQGKGFTSPEEIRNLVAKDTDHAFKLLNDAALESEDPLYVLIWGAMSHFGRLLNRNPELADNIRVITIGSGLMYPPDEKHAPNHWPGGASCALKNWNGPGRSDIWNNPRFKDMWWLELNWTYNGMFAGEEPRRMFEKLSGYGALGQHMVDVTKNEPWAQYFRVGDTPSVLYVIDPRGNQDDPRQSSWAGRFVNPLPDDRPNYYADHNGPAEWDYNDPCNTWDNSRDVYEYSKSTLEKERPGMYNALIEKLDRIYGRTGECKMGR